MHMQKESPLNSSCLSVENNKDKDNIQVLVRIRPLSSKEVSEGSHSCLIADDQDPQKITLDCKTDVKSFLFDYVATEKITQIDFFELVGKPLSHICLDGYNICVFAYGQTGAGKTYTMQGKIDLDTERGLQPNVFNYLFKLMGNLRDEWDYQVRCSYLAIYNEQINDLLKTNNCGLQIREDIKKGPFVEGLTEEKVGNAHHLLEIMKKGMRNRHVGSTYMNMESSRSHSIFTLYVEGKKKENNVINERISKLNFVDLAGSERQKQSGTVGNRLKEAGNINKSLTILGCVINSLVESSRRKSRHIPYRDSKLTFILRDSLGGNSKTWMIAAVSAASSSFCETLSTLKFAQRAKLIKNQACVNEETTGNADMLKIEIKRLKEELNKFMSNKQSIMNIDANSYENKEKEKFFWILLNKSLGIQENLHEQILTSEKTIEKLKEFLKICAKNELIYKYLIHLYQKTIKEGIKNFNDEVLLKERNFLYDLLINYNWVVQKYNDGFIEGDTFSLTLSDKYLENKLLCEEILFHLKDSNAQKTQDNSQMNFNRIGDANSIFNDVSNEEMDSFIKSFLNSDTYAPENSLKSMLQKEKLHSEDLENDIHRLHEEYETLQISLNYEREESKRKTEIINILELKALHTTNIESQISKENKSLLEENSLIKIKMDDLKNVLEEQEFDLVYLKNMEIENQKKNEDLENEILNLQVKLKDIEEENDKNEIELFEIKEENISLNDKLEALTIENDIIKAEKIEEIEKSEKMKEEMEYKNKLFSDTLKDKNGKIDQLNHENDLQKQNIDFLQKELFIFKQENHDLKSKNDILNQQNSNLSQEINNLNQINKELKLKNETEILKLNELLLTIKEKIKEKDKRIETLMKENEIKEQELFRTAVNLNETLNQYKTAFEELKTVESLKKENEKLKDSLKVSNEENERLDSLYKKLEYQSNIMKANYRIKEVQTIKANEEKKLAELMSSKYLKQIQNLSEKIQISNFQKYEGDNFVGINKENINKPNPEFMEHLGDIKKENFNLKNEVISLKEIIDNCKKQIEELSRKNHQDPKKVMISLEEIFKLKSEIKELKQEKKMIFESFERINNFMLSNNYSFDSFQEEIDLDNFYSKLESLIINIKERENKIFEKESELEINESKLIIVKQEYNLMVKNIELKKTEFSPNRLEKFNYSFKNDDDKDDKFGILAKSEKLLKKKKLQIDDYLTLPKKKIKLF